MLPDFIDSLGLTDPWTYFAIFLVASLLMMWRLEAMLDHGLEGTALGTLIMPYCTGLGNLLFVFILVQRGGAAKEVLTNCLVNNVTNLTLLLGLPAALWGLQLIPAKRGSSGAAKKGAKAPAKGKAAPKGKGGGDAATGAQVNRLSLLLTLTAVFFFTGATWLLAQDGQLSRTDGIVLCGLFLFWQSFQVYDVLKHNVQRKVSFGAMFYVDAVVVLASAWALYESIDWLVTWITAQKAGFVSSANLGWLSGWLMVLPNAIPAFYWGWKKRADVVYTSQVGDGHICIPLCVGLFAILMPSAVPAVFGGGLALLLGAVVVHAFCALVFGGLPRWAGGIMLAAYGWFVWDGLIA
ncbi:MAG TPA: sodium:calcium symporter [Candidatus Didemnitutus sp.]|nr:sodium:calcium symporter [Candidatus Didemnitutus sp.]